MNKKKFIQGIQTLEEYHESMQEIAIFSLQKQASYKPPKLDKPMSQENYLRDLSEERPNTSHHKFSEHRWRATELAQLIFGNRSLSRNAWNFIYTVIMLQYVHEYYYKCSRCDGYRFLDTQEQVQCSNCHGTGLVYDDIPF